MNVFEFVLVFVGAAMFFAVWRTKHLARHGLYEAGKDDVRPLETGREEALQREVEDLRAAPRAVPQFETEERR